MKISDAGLDLIKSFEGLKLIAYPDPATGADPWTIGYGSTRGVHEHMTITKEEADRRLRIDVEASEKCVNACVAGTILQCQFDALVCFAFNVGCGALRGSTLLRKLNAGEDDHAVADEFLRWNKAAGKIMSGLTRRRQAERELFLKGDA